MRSADVVIIVIVVSILIIIILFTIFTNVILVFTMLLFGYINLLAHAVEKALAIASWPFARGNTGGASGDVAKKWM